MNKVEFEDGFKRDIVDVFFFSWCCLTAFIVLLLKSMAILF